MPNMTAGAEKLRAIARRPTGYYSGGVEALQAVWDAAIEAATAAIIEAAPPMNAELRMNVETGEATVNPVMAAYVEGFHDAWSAVQALTPIGDPND